MNYALHYIKTILPHLYFVVTLGLFEKNVNWRVRLTFWVLGLFWIMDILPILLSGGKLRSVWHSVASDLFFEEQLMQIAATNDKCWSKRFCSVTSHVLFSPCKF